MEVRLIQDFQKSGGLAVSFNRLLDSTEKALVASNNKQQNKKEVSV